MLFKLDKKGFTLVEIIITASIMSMLAANIALPNYFKQIEIAKENICAEARRVTEHAEINYAMDTGKHSVVLQDLLDAGYIKGVPECSSGGVYAWESADEDGSNYQTVIICSVHGIPGETMTPLESSFNKISSNFIRLLNEYSAENGKYPKGDWKKTIKALDLDPDEWSGGVDGIVYRPQGNIVSIQPDRGYVFYVKDTSGSQETVEGKTQLKYSMENDTWYYGKVKTGNEINIDTLQVEKK